MRTQAIILKKIPIREYDDMVVCYTLHAGKQIYQAKSIRRSTSKQASHLDLLNYIDFSLVGSNGYPIITSAYALKTFSGLKSDLRALVVGYFLLEVFDKLVFEGEADTRLWNFLLLNLEKLDKLAGKSEQNLFRTIEIIKKELLIVMGYDASAQIEQIAGARFKSLQFARKVIG